MEYKILRMNAETLEFEEIKVKDKAVSYEELRDAVGGYIEHVTFNLPMHEANIDVWIDEEGKLKDLKPTTIVVSRSKNKVVETLNGSLVFTSRNDRGDSLPLSTSQIELIKNEMKLTTLLIGKDNLKCQFTRNLVRVLPYR